MQFTPLKDFRDEELRSVYCVGLSYTVRPGDELLAQKLPGWIEQGLVRLGAPDSPQPTAARISGGGDVN